MNRLFAVIYTNNRTGEQKAKKVSGQCHDDCDTITEMLKNTQKGWDEWHIDRVTEISRTEQCG